MMNKKINRFNISRFTVAAVFVFFIFAFTSCNGLFGGKSSGTAQKQKVTVTFSTVNKDAAANENFREAGSNTTALSSNLSEDFSEVVKIELIAYVNDTTAYDFTAVNVTGAGIIDTADSTGKNKITWQTSTDEDEPETLITAYQKLKDSTIELFCDSYKFTMNLYIETPYNSAKLVQTGTLTVDVGQETTSITVPTSYCPEQYGDFSYTIYWSDDCGIDKIEAGLFTGESKGQTAYSIPDGQSFDFEELQTNEADDGTDRRYVNYTVANLPAGNYVFKYKLYAASPSVGSTEYISLVPNNGSIPLSVQINGYKTEKVIALNKESINQLSRGDGGIEVISGPDISIVPNPRDDFDEDVCYLNKGSFVITSDLLHNKYEDDTSFIKSFDIKLYYGNNLVPSTEDSNSSFGSTSDYYSLGCNSLFSFSSDDSYIKAIIFDLDDEHELLAGGYYSLYVTAKINGSDAVSSTYYTFYVENKEYYNFWLDGYSSAETFKSALTSKLENISADVKLKICGNPGDSGTDPVAGYFSAVTEALDACNCSEIHTPYLIDLDMSTTGDRLVEMSQNDWLGSGDEGGNGIRSIKLSPYVQTVGSFYQLPALEEIYLYDGGNLRLGGLYWDSQTNEELFDDGYPIYAAPKLSKFVIEAKDADNNPTVPKYEVIADKIILRTIEDSENGDYREIFYAVPGLTDEIYGPDLSELDLTDESVWGIGCADPESTACIKAINDYAFQTANLSKIISLGKVDTLGKAVFDQSPFSEIHIDRIPANLPDTTGDNSYNNVFTDTLADILYVDIEITEDNYDGFKNYINSAPNENGYCQGLEFKNVVFNQNVYMKDLAEQFDSDNNTWTSAYFDSLCFNAAGSLESVSFKKDAYIGKYQFNYYTSLKNVSIGTMLDSSSVENPFYGCYSLTNITVDPENNYYKTNAAGSILVKDVSKSTSYAEVICVTANLTVADFSDEDFATLIESDSIVQSIGKYAFSNCVSNLSSLNLSGIVYIGDYAFAGASSWNVESFTLPDSVIAIGLNAFKNTNGDCLLGEDSGTTFAMSVKDNWYACSDDNISEAVKEWAFAENDDKPVIGTPDGAGIVTVDDTFYLVPKDASLIENAIIVNSNTCYYRDTRTGD